MQKCIVKGLAISYRKKGNGPVVLMLHGWGDSADTFKQISERLSRHFTLIIPDFPGFGSSQAPKTVWGIPEYSQFVAEFTEKINLKPYALIGHSNGGAVSMYALAHGLLNAQKLVLLASAGIRREQSVKKQVYKIVAKIGKQVTKFMPRPLQQKIKKRFYGLTGSDIFVAPHLEQSFKKVVGYDIQKEASAIKLPTLLVYGEDDEATPARFGQMLKNNIIESRLEIIPNTGHFLHQEQTSKVVGLIEEFLL